jgi:hypothetical protein
MTRHDTSEDWRIDLDVLAAITAVQDSGKHDGRAPNWCIPGHIPTQRLQGLKRRGLLAYNASEWWLTARGIVVLAELQQRGQRERAVA